MRPELRIDLASVKHHPAIEAMVDVLCAKTQTMDRDFFAVVGSFFLVKMAATMRVSAVSKDRGAIPVNSFVIAVARSGHGKGYSVSIAEDEFIGPFVERFRTETFPRVAKGKLHEIAARRAGAADPPLDQNEEFKRVEAEFRSYGAFTFTFDSGTGAAVKQYRQKLLMAQCGAISLQVDEIGMNLPEAGVKDLLSQFLELFDQGKIKGKLLKESKESSRGEDISGKTPTNALFFGSPSKLFDGGSTEELFYSLLDTGYARRCFFACGIQKKDAVEATAEEIYRSLTQTSTEDTVRKWAAHFEALADPLMLGWQAEVSDEVAIQLIEYKLACEKVARELPEHDDIRRAELEHRYSKTIKLAATLAWIDNSMFVEMDHLHQAMKLCEISGDAFNRLLTRDKNYVRLAKFIAEENKELTHADIHEKLPFYGKSKGTRDEMMTLAIAYGVKHNIVIKKSFEEGIEFYKGETLKPSDLDQVTLSYSTDWAFDYLPARVPFDALPKVFAAPGYHWCAHHFRGGHRDSTKAIPGFDLVVLDIDGGVSLQAVHELLKDYRFFTYTTPSHQQVSAKNPDGADRFRLILPLNYRLEMDQDEYREFMNNLHAWLPFAITDTASNKIAQKWTTNPSGQVYASKGTELVDALPFIPKTAKNDSYLKQSSELGSLDNAERWFAVRMVPGQRNNMMFRFATMLANGGMAHVDVENAVRAFDKKLKNPLGEAELNSSVFVSLAKHYQQKTP